MTPDEAQQIVDAAVIAVIFIGFAWSIKR